MDYAMPTRSHQFATDLTTWNKQHFSDEDEIVDDDDMYLF